MLHNRTKALKWRQTQEQRILDNVKQSTEKQKATDSHPSEYTFQRFTMTELGPSALSPNPCRLLISKFLPLGSAVSPHEITGRRLKSTLIEKLKSRSPSIYSFKKQNKQFSQSLTPSSSTRKSRASSKSPLKDMTISDLNHDFNATSQLESDKDMIEDLPNLKSNVRQNQIKQSKSSFSTVYATIKSKAMKSNVDKDFMGLSVTGVSTNTAKERLFTHMSREDIEQEALRNRLLEDAGFKKEKKYIPYVRLADRKQPNSASISGERMRIQQIMTANSAFTRKHQEEQQRRPTTEIRLNTKSITNIPSVKKESTVNKPHSEKNSATSTNLSNYISRQSQSELLATYQQASIKLRTELHEKRCKRDDLQNKLRYLQILASMRLQPDKVPLGFYCYLNLPCCHCSINPEHYFPIGELCIKCRQRIENCIMIKADIAS